MSEVNVSVSIPNEGDFESTVKAAEAMGLHVKQALDILGVAVGTIEESSLARLNALPGIGSVEREREYGVPTPVRVGR